MRATRRPLGGSRRTAMLARPPRKRSIGNVFERGLVPRSASVVLPGWLAPISQSVTPLLKYARDVPEARLRQAPLRRLPRHCDRSRPSCHLPLWRPNENPMFIDDWQSARKGNQPVIGVLDAVKRFARLGQLPQLAGGHAKERCGLCLLDGNIDAPDPGVVHTEEGF